MSCVLRITAPEVQSRLAAVRLRAFRIEGDTAHFVVSDSSFDDLPGQVEDALSFLLSHKSEIKVLMEGAGTEGLLDFAIDTGMGFVFRRFTAPLVREAGELGLALEVSIYPAASHEG